MVVFWQIQTCRWYFDKYNHVWVRYSSFLGSQRKLDTSSLLCKHPSKPIFQAWENCIFRALCIMAKLGLPRQPCQAHLCGYLSALHILILEKYFTEKGVYRSYNRVYHTFPLQVVCQKQKPQLLSKRTKHIWSTKVPLMVNQVTIREATRDKKQFNFGFLLKGGEVQPKSKGFEELFKEPFFGLSLEKI